MGHRADAPSNAASITCTAVVLWRSCVNRTPRVQMFSHTPIVNLLPTQEAKSTGVYTQKEHNIALPPIGLNESYRGTVL